MFMVVTVLGGGFSVPSVHANGLTIQSDGKIFVVGGYIVSVPRHGLDTAITFSPSWLIAVICFNSITSSRPPRSALALAQLVRVRATQ